MRSQNLQKISQYVSLLGQLVAVIYIKPSVFKNNVYRIYIFYSNINCKFKTVQNFLMLRPNVKISLY